MRVGVVPLYVMRLAREGPGGEAIVDRVSVYTRALGHAIGGVSKAERTIDLDV